MGYIAQDSKTEHSVSCIESPVGIRPQALGVTATVSISSIEDGYVARRIGEETEERLLSALSDAGTTGDSLLYGDIGERPTKGLTDKEFRDILFMLRFGLIDGGVYRG